MSTKGSEKFPVTVQQMSDPTSFCDGTGTEARYAPNRQELQCYVCKQTVAVASDGKRTWFKAHSPLPAAPKASGALR